MTFGQRKIPSLPVALGPLAWGQCVALPIEIGLWMSRLDLGGPRAAEQAGIEQALLTLTQKFINRPMIKEILDETRRRPIPSAPLPEGVLWSVMHDLLPRLQEYLSPPDLAAYKLVLIDMAESMARTHFHPALSSRWLKIFTKPVGQVMEIPRVTRARRVGLNQLIDQVAAKDLVKKWPLVSVAVGPSARAFTTPLSAQFFQHRR